MNDVVDLIKKIQKSEKLAKKEGNEIPKSDLEEISGGGVNITVKEAKTNAMAIGDGSEANNSSRIYM